MEDILAKLAGYAASKDSRLACAAAVILTELAPRDSEVTRKLAGVLEAGDPVRRPFIIEALGRIGTAEAAEVLVPLIRSEGPASEQALRAVAHTAGSALKPLLKLVGTVPSALLERISECIARTGEPAGYAGLFSALTGADIETCRAIRGGLRMAMTTFPDKFKENLHKQLEKAFDDVKLTGHQPALIALLKIAGDLGDTSFLKLILKRTDANAPLNVRRSALQALSRLHLTGEKRGEIAGRILPLLLDSDIGNIAEPALEAVRQAQLTAEHAPAVRKLLQSQSSRIREFAMQALARVGNARSLNELIACLDHSERLVREEAFTALGSAPAAAPILAERLIKTENADDAQESAKALARVASELPEKMCAALANAYVSTIQNGTAAPGSEEARLREAKQRAIVNLFRTSKSVAFVEAIFAYARKLRQKDDHQRAHELLKTASGLAGWGDQQKIEMALSGLSYGARDLSRSARANDSNLRLLEEALAAGVKPAELAKTVNRDGGLSRKSQHYLGFHFVEKMHGDREFGTLVLQKLSESRSEEGKQAKEKLVIEGLLNTKGGKAAILEDRAKVMFAASDLAAASAHREKLAASARKAAKKGAKLSSAKGKAKKIVAKSRR